ncbi:hypothetical protein D6D28_07911 [Aureobasidium pullulans]|uniref:Uncharacterized protein n=1 Tax=Aureobasidium pullulans TaxID=5580 RepID=A0A4S8S9E8_AURPU|nr:hypothetical protein D6D28_07911 [Aureobasidium pullulans]
MPQPDWLPGNGKVDYFAQVILYDGTLLISGEPAKDKLSALVMLLWTWTTTLSSSPLAQIDRDPSWQSQLYAVH